MKCALVIGHSENSPGAENTTYDISEYVYNSLLVTEIYHKLRHTGLIEVEIVYRDTLKDLPDKINSLNPDFIVSFHCNAYNWYASGTEVLYYHKSSPGKSMAFILNKKLNSALGLKNRGTIGVTSEDRGGYLLRYTKAPAVIAEPFFIDNNADLERAIEKRTELIKAYCDSILDIAKAMSNQ